MEVLDSLLRESYLSDQEVQQYAEQIAHSPAVLGLGDGVGQETLAKLASDGIDPEVLNETRRVGFTRTISQAVVSEVMSDGLGRSEMHMAAEVCRVNFAFHKILKNEVNLGFVVPEGLDVIENLRDTGTDGFWNPTDTPFTCPTIDGFPPNRKRHFIIYGAPEEVSSFHLAWYAHLRNDLFKLMAMGELELLQPPLFLIGGNIIAGDDPRFFMKSSRRGSGRDTTPVPDDPRLVLA